MTYPIIFIYADIPRCRLFLLLGNCLYGWLFKDDDLVAVMRSTSAKLSVQSLVDLPLPAETRRFVVVQ